jgi:hypothetical protein
MIHQVSFLVMNLKHMVLPAARGIWVLLIVPAIIAFAFGIWVFYSVIMTDAAKTVSSRFAVVGPDTIRMKVDRPEG